VIAFLYFHFSAFNSKSEDDINPEEFLSAPDAIRIPAAKVIPEKLSEVKDTDISDRVVKEKEPFVHLIKEAAKLVYGDMEILGLKKADSKAILDDPSACRGLPYEIKGNLQWYEEITDLDFKLFRGYILSLEGEYFYFTVREMPRDLKIDDVVKLQGFFYKVYSFNLQGEDKRINNAVYLVGKSLIPSFYELQPALKLDFALLDTLYDFNVEDMFKPFEEKPLYHMLSFVNNIDDETFELMRKDKLFEEHLAKDIRAKPGVFRGAPVRVLGEIIWTVERTLGPEGENPIGVRSVYHGININYRGNFCYFISFEDPKEMKKDGMFYHDGFFFRNFAYKSRNDKICLAPVLIARGFERYNIPEDNTLKLVSYAILIGAILAGFCFITYIVRDRKENLKYRDKFIKRKKLELSRVISEQNKQVEAAGSPPTKNDSDQVLDDQ